MFILLRNIILPKMIKDNNVFRYLGLIIIFLLLLSVVIIEISGNIVLTNPCFILASLIIFQLFRTINYVHFYNSKAKLFKWINTILSDIFLLTASLSLIFAYGFYFDTIIDYVPLIFFISYIYKKSAKYTALITNKDGDASKFTLSFYPKIKDNIIFIINRVVWSWELLSIIGFILYFTDNFIYFSILILLKYTISFLLYLFDELFIRKNSLVARFTTVILIIGLIAIYILVLKEGPKEIWNIFSSVPIWKWFVICFIYLWVFVIDTASFLYCLKPKQREKNFFTMLKAFISGAAISKLTPTGLVGEAVKASFLRGKIDLKEVTASLVVWNFLVVIIGVFWTLIISIVFYFYVSLPWWTLAIIFGAIMVISFPTLFSILLIKRNFFSRLVNLLHRFRRAKETILKWHNRIADMEDRILKIYETRKWDLFKASILLVLSKLISLTVSYLRVWLLGIDASFFDVVFISNMQSTLLSLLTFVPSGFGIAEVFDKFMFQYINLSSTEALSIPLVYRVIQLILTFTGISFIFMNRLKENDKNNGKN